MTTSHQDSWMLEKTMLHRRDAMIRLGQVGLGGLTMPGLLAATERAKTGRPATAKSCILVYLWGGPPQQETFDPSPTPRTVSAASFRQRAPRFRAFRFATSFRRSPNRPASWRSSVPTPIQQPARSGGVSHTHRQDQQHAGRAAQPPQPPRFPHDGKRGELFSPSGDLPTSVTIPRPIGHDGVIYTGTYAGFLGPQHDPLELQAPAEVQERAAHGLELPEGWDAHRLQSRFGLLGTLEQYDRLNQQHAQRLSGLGQFREQAFRMLTSPAAKGAFDLSKEADSIRDRYGRNEYGEGFLLARRLIEAGVRLVTFVWYYVCKDGNVANVWDNHGGTPSLDRPAASRC